MDISKQIKSFFIEYNTSYNEILELFSQAKSEALPVVSKGKLLGIISLFSLIKASSEFSIENAIIKDIYSINDINKIESVNIIYNILPVLNKKGEYVGYFESNLIKEYVANKEKQILELEIEAILGVTQEGIHITDEKGTTTRFNKACESIDHIKGDFMIGKNMNDLVRKGVYSTSVALEIINKKKKLNIMQRVNNKDIFACGVPIFLNNKLVRVLVNAHDVTEVNRLRKKLAVSESTSDKYEQELQRLRKEECKNLNLIYNCKEMDTIVDLCYRIQNVDSTVLLYGESGTGKEVLSKFIHYTSIRKKNMFVKIDCASIPESLLESELFGYEGGSFTGASREGKVGLIEVANNGTLFLDEIGDMPLTLQVKLLRLLQEREIVRVGGRNPIKVNIRVIAATNKNLKEMVEKRLFREDLFYRLNVIPIEIPSLRQRKEDIPDMLIMFCKKFNEKYNLKKSFSPNAVKLLMEYQWPGNVRELQNMVERLIVTTRNEVIEKEDVLDQIPIESNIMENYNKEDISLKEAVINYETKLLQEALRKSFNIHQLAEITKSDVSTLRKKCKRYGIKINFNKEE